MAFAEDKRTYSETRKRTSNAYVKFSPDYRVVLRILNPNARMTWKHWIGEANAGKGMMATCPNKSAQDQVCPIEISLRGLPKDDTRVMERKAKKRFTVNVLDRTPHTVCDSCNTQTPGKKCINCGADLKKNSFAPLNKVKILEGGPQLFTQTLNGVDTLQTEEFGLEITDYDITFQTQGVGRDRKISAIPAAATVIGEAEMVDPETGEPQRLFDLDLLSEPTPVEEIELMLKGATIDDLNQIRGVA
jgi:hypothetical protein